MKAASFLGLFAMAASAFAAEDDVKVELQFPAEKVSMAVLLPAVTYRPGIPWITQSSMAAVPTTYSFSGKAGDEKVFIFDAKVKKKGGKKATSNHLTVSPTPGSLAIATWLNGQGDEWTRD